MLAEHFGFVKPRLATEKGMIRGPLVVSADNPRYFADPQGNIVWLAGSNVKLELQDRDGSIAQYEYVKYLNFLQARGHSYMRMWRHESTEAAGLNPDPWSRPGPGAATDGLFKYDLTGFYQPYFDRLRYRIIQAGQRGIYVAIVLFKSDLKAGAEWNNHPARDVNNINTIDGGNGTGWATQDGTISALQARYEAFVQKVIDTVNDLDNVLFEIVNEGDVTSHTWQNTMVTFIVNAEASKPKQHLVIRSASLNWQATPDAEDGNSNLLASSADALALGNGAAQTYAPNPPAITTTTYIYLMDTDHTHTTDSTDWIWIWKCLARGYGGIGYLDTGADQAFPEVNSVHDAWRSALREAKVYAHKMNLKQMTPQNGGITPCETGFCLQFTGAAAEYLALQPGTGEFDLTVVAGTYNFEWFNPTTNAVVSTGSTGAISGLTVFTPPFAGAAVLWLKKT